jgi:hypothetical protein
MIKKASIISKTSSRNTAETLFPSYNNYETKFSDIPEGAGKRFIILLLSFVLNFTDKYKRPYYFRNAMALKNAFNVPGHLLILPIKWAPSKLFLINEILFYVRSFSYLLQTHSFSISSHQSILLEKIYNAFLWEEC